MKEVVAFSGADGNRGAIRLGEETLDPGKAPDVEEVFNVGLELASNDSDLIASKSFRAANVWPVVPGFRTVMIELLATDSVGGLMARDRCLSVQYRRLPDALDQRRLCIYVSTYLRRTRS